MIHNFIKDAAAAIALVAFVTILTCYLPDVGAAIHQVLP